MYVHPYMCIRKCHRATSRRAYSIKSVTIKSQSHTATNLTITWPLKGRRADIGNISLEILYKNLGMIYFIYSSGSIGINLNLVSQIEKFNPSTETLTVHSSSSSPPLLYLIFGILHSIPSPVVLPATSYDSPDLI